MKKVASIILSLMIIHNIQALQSLRARLPQAAHVSFQAAMRPAVRRMVTETGSVTSQPTLSWWQRFKTGMQNPFQNLKDNWRQYRARVFENKVQSEMPAQRVNFSRWHSFEQRYLDESRYAYKKALQEGNAKNIEEFGRNLQDRIARFDRSIEQWDDFFAKRPMFRSEREAYKRVAQGWKESLARSKAELAQQLEMNQPQLAQFHAREKILRNNRAITRSIEMIPQTMERNFFMLENDLNFFKTQLAERMEVLRSTPETDVVLRENTQKVIDLLDQAIVSLERSVILF